MGDKGALSTSRETTKGFSSRKVVWCTTCGWVVNITEQEIAYEEYVDGDACRVCGIGPIVIENDG